MARKDSTFAVLAATLAATVKHASTDTTRPHLNAVRVERSAGKGDRSTDTIRFIATDGHRLCIAELCNVKPGLGFESATVELKAIVELIRSVKAASKDWPHNEGAVYLHNSATTETVRRLSVGMLQDSPSPIEPGAHFTADDDLKFPPYQQVMPKHDAKPGTISHVNPSYFADACCLAESIGAKAITTIAGTSELDPISVKAEKPGVGEVRAIVMPVRV